MLLRTILLSEFSGEKSEIIASKTLEESTTWQVMEDYIKLSFIIKDDTSLASRSTFLDVQALYRPTKSLIKMRSTTKRHMAPAEYLMDEIVVLSKVSEIKGTGSAN
jgi:hypothetical protein